MDFFHYIGMQCTIMFLLFTMQQELNPQNIASHEIDHVLLEGTALYGSIITSRPPDEASPYLGHHELPSSVPGFSGEYHVFLDQFSGVVVSK